MEKKLFQMFEEKGWKGRIVPYKHMAELTEVIHGYYEQGLIDEKLYRDQLGFLSSDLKTGLRNARSIIIIGIPTPQMRIYVNWQGSRIPVIIPPTYVSYTKRTVESQSDIESLLNTSGYHLSRPQLPLKTLAVMSGLAEYGRNNLGYIPGMGSYFQLVGAISDLPCMDDPWQAPKMMDRCKNCVACIQFCPSKAITQERFLIQAELCLTYHNESSDDFPDWIDPRWHHCLIGCMKCQSVCPMNKNVWKWFEDRAEFTESETSLMLRKTPPQKLPHGTFTKIRQLEINEDYLYLCRNLSMLIPGQR